MPSMSQATIDSFLDRDFHAILATISQAGRPQLTPIWFLYEEGRIYVSAQASTVKARNLRRNPAISICVDGGRGDPRYVVLSGDATLVEPGAPGQEEMRRRIIRKYSSSDAAAEAYYESIRESEAVTIVLEPDRIVSQDFSE